MNRVVVAAGAVVMLGGLAAAAPQPTRTPRSARGLTPAATPRLTVIRGPQGPRGVPGPQERPDSPRWSTCARATRCGRAAGGTASWRRARAGSARSRAASSSPLLRVVLSAPLASGAGRTLASGWFVPIANLDTRPHVASAEVVYAVTQ